MYHHIADLQSDVWDIAVSPLHFDQQLDILHKKGNVISVYKMIELLKNNSLTQDYIAITFDDGYLDNLTTAVPVLKKYNLPATFFITSKQEDALNYFWWDELEYIFLFTENLPQYFKMIINDELIEADLANETQASYLLKKIHEKWNACEELPPTKRAELFYRVWEVLKPLSTKQQADYLNQIKSWSNTTMPQDFPYKVMTPQQISAPAVLNSTVSAGA